MFRLLSMMFIVWFCISFFEVCCSNSTAPVAQTSSINDTATFPLANTSITADAKNDSSNSSVVEFKINHRFDRNFVATKDKDLTLLISITSGPNPHLRDAAR